MALRKGIYRMLGSLFLLYLGLLILSIAKTVIVAQGIVPTLNDFKLDSLPNHNHTIASIFTGYLRGSDNEKKTLALLYPPGMIGGYRNQVIRFTGFVAHAKKNNATQLLLPSILWSTTYKAANDERRFFPVPMDLLFDVDHWNSFYHLPRLVDSIENSDCWDVQNGRDGYVEEVRVQSNAGNLSFVSPMLDNVLSRSALLTPIIDQSRAFLTGRLRKKVRKLDFYPDVENCSHPIVYGGGRGAGRLWNDYLYSPKIQPGTNDSTDLDAIRFTRLISSVSQALRPSKQWRDVAHQCILQHLPNQQKKIASPKQQTRATGYVALHARVEVDMMLHRCGKNMEKNLTKIISMVDAMVEDHNVDPQHQKLQGVFVAVSRLGMQQPTKNNTMQDLAKANWETLKKRSVPANRQMYSTVFECGETWMNRWYSTQTDIEEDYFGSLVPSLMNFYIATHATIFVGVAKSSWSTDVWTTRYYQGKGDSNFQYTPEGIIPVPNGGLPAAHTKC